MKKIRLDPESLEVHSFATEQDSQGRGTVLAAATGNTCYITVSRDAQTHCLAYPVSYWGEATCTCPLEPVTSGLRCQPILTADLTCLTCPGQPGC
jgi:hypothetical protein